MGPDPTQSISWLTQPDQPNTTNNGAYSLVVTYFYTLNLTRSYLIIQASTDS